MVSSAAKTRGSRWRVRGLGACIGAWWISELRQQKWHCEVLYKTRRIPSWAAGVRKPAALERRLES